MLLFLIKEGVILLAACFDRFAAALLVILRRRSHAGVAVVLGAACAGAEEVESVNTGGADRGAASTLAPEEIREGLHKVESVAIACGPTHGAFPGTSVQVRLSISGTTGTVVEANADPPHDATDLGDCVERALGAATFRTFDAASLGVSYPVRF